MSGLSSTVSYCKTALVEVSVRQHVTAVSEGSVKAERVVLLRSHFLNDLSDPVGVSEVVRVCVVAHLVEVFRKPCVCGIYIFAGLVVECHEFDSVAHFRKSRRSLDTCIC